MTTSSAVLRTDVTVLKQLTAIRLDVAIWTARKKLTAADFGSSDLPPEKLASLGSKRVCNPEDLRIFAALKARAVALLERTGVRFLGGWAIPEAKTAPVVEELGRIGSAFEDAKAAFLSRYDEAIRQWIADNPGWEPLIAGSTVGVDTVRSRLGFGWQVFQVAPPRTKGKTAAFSSSLTSEVMASRGRCSTRWRSLPPKLGARATPVRAKSRRRHSRPCGDCGPSSPVCRSSNPGSHRLPT